MTCTDCKLDKPETAFSKDCHSPTGLRRYCRDCAAILYKKDYDSRPEYYRDRAAKWAAANPEKRKRVQKNADLKAAYGITLKEFEAMLEVQSGKCKICEKPMAPACVDHCHDTGKIRGLLCSGCNSGIGGLCHSIPNLQAAIAYLTPITPSDKETER